MQEGEELGGLWRVIVSEQIFRFGFLEVEKRKMFCSTRVEVFLGFRKLTNLVKLGRQLGQLFNLSIVFLDLNE